MLVEWNRTARDYPRDKCIHQLFEEQVERTPDAVAVSLARPAADLRELNHRANRLAHHLRRLGVGADKTVGVCLDRSHKSVGGLAGDSQSRRSLCAPGSGLSGGTLDVHAAGQRRHSHTHRAFTASRLGEESGVKVLDLASGHGSRGRESNTVENPGISDRLAQDLAYIMYTSGSTGRPKGVAIPHRAVVRLVAAEKSTRSSTLFETFSC